jgi:hypothetical protein
LRLFAAIPVSAAARKEKDMNEVDGVEKQACCGGPAPKEADACCVKDADAKAAGETGCGCGVPKTGEPRAPVAASSCCG